MANSRWWQNGWSKALLAMLIPLLAAAVGFGVVKERTTSNKEDIARVEMQTRESLRDVHVKLDKILERLSND